MIRCLVSLLTLGMLVAAALWGGGLAWFIVQIPYQSLQNPPEADAIVVLTGGKGRIEAGVDLLAAHKAKKLFISGVSKGVKISELLLAAHRPGMAAENITLGYEATTTKGNAEETARWVAEQGYTHLLLVTSSYHMPRSLLELRHAMPEIAITPAPVMPPEFMHAEWWRDKATTRLILLEYHKYLTVSAQFLLEKLSGNRAAI